MDHLYNASLSTMWAKGNAASLADFLQLARRMGFARAELNYKVNSAMLAGIKPWEYRFSSIHEPCPADVSVDTLKWKDWLISATDEAERSQGVKAIMRSIDLAHELGVRVIVVHAGNVQPDMGAERNLRALIKSGRRETDQYQETLDKLFRQRAAKAGPRLDAVKKSLRELLIYADRFGVRLSLENRDHYMHIPILPEMEELLALAGPEQIGFTYDVGHAQALDVLGIYAHEEWLKRYASRMFGAHLHDVNGLEDHAAPGLGGIDFRRIGPYLPPSAFRTLELRPRNTPEQVQNGLRYLAECGCVSMMEN